MRPLRSRPMIAWSLASDASPTLADHTLQNDPKCAQNACLATPDHRSSARPDRPRGRAARRAGAGRQRGRDRALGAPAPPACRCADRGPRRRLRRGADRVAPQGEGSPTLRRAQRRRAHQWRGERDGHRRGEAARPQHRCRRHPHRAGGAPATGQGQMAAQRGRAGRGRRRPSRRGGAHRLRIPAGRGAEPAPASG